MYPMVAQDTLLLLGMETEAAEARRWVAHNMTLHQVRLFPGLVLWIPARQTYASCRFTVEQQQQTSTWVDDYRHTVVLSAASMACAGIGTWQR